MINKVLLPSPFDRPPPKHGKVVTCQPQECKLAIDLLEGLYANNDNSACKIKTTVLMYTATGAIAGQMLFPVPVIGAVMGGAVGYSVAYIKIVANEAMERFYRWSQDQNNNNNNNN